jgi:hypothetical protein
VARIFVRSAEPAVTVTDPDTLLPLPAEGGWVPFNSYWLLKLQQGEVILTTPDGELPEYPLTVPLLVGVGAPVAGFLADGDIYLDLQGMRVYGPRTAGEWGSGVDLGGGGGGPANTDGLAEGSTNLYYTGARVAATLAGATGKTTPVDADSLPLTDSAASGALKRLTWANLKATLKTYFDGLYATVSGFTMSGALAMGGNLITQPLLRDVREAAGSYTLSSGTLTLDFATGNNFAVALNQNVTSLVFSNVPASGWVFLAIRFQQDATGGRTVSGWPAGTRWPGGSAPTITATANARDTVSGVRVDGETVFQLGRSQEDMQ